jgi:rubredoxin
LIDALKFHKKAQPLDIRFANATLLARRWYKIKNKELHIMERWICTICQYVYDPALGDPDRGIAPGTSFEALPDDWACPLCGAGKDAFEKE